MQLNVLVMSTKRKRRIAPNHLCLRSLQTIPSGQRLEQWVARLSDSVVETCAAYELYAGDHWQIARSLPGQVAINEWDVCLWVCSPGYGLIKAGTMVQPYSATLSVTHPDFICDRSADDRIKAQQRWWAGLCSWSGPDPNSPRSVAEIVKRAPNTPMVVIASPAFIKFLELDLLTARSEMATTELLILISGGSKKNGVLAEHLLPSNARLQGALGGALMSLNVRTLRYLLDQPPEVKERLADAWSARLLRVLEQSPTIERPVRKQLTDDEVRDFIRQMRESQSQSSWSPLLARLRAVGCACEQKRFRGLFADVQRE